VATGNASRFPAGYCQRILLAGNGPAPIKVTDLIAT